MKGREGGREGGRALLTRKTGDAAGGADVVPQSLSHPVLEGGEGGKGESRREDGREGGGRTGRSSGCWCWWWGRVFVGVAGLEVGG